MQYFPFFFYSQIILRKQTIQKVPFGVLALCLLGDFFGVVRSLLVDSMTAMDCRRSSFTPATEFPLSVKRFLRTVSDFGPMRQNMKWLNSYRFLVLHSSQNYNLCSSKVISTYFLLFQKLLQLMLQFVFYYHPNRNIIGTNIITPQV